MNIDFIGIFANMRTSSCYKETFYNEMWISSVDFRSYIEHFSQFRILNPLFFDIYAYMRAGSCYEDKNFKVFHNEMWILTVDFRSFIELFSQY